MGKIRNMIFGEKMPDKDAPGYQEKYEKGVEAGRRFARATRLDRLAGHVQCFADRHRKLFLGIVFGIVIACFAVNVHHMATAVKVREERRSATQAQEEILKEKIQKSHTVKSLDDGIETEN